MFNTAYNGAFSNKIIIRTAPTPNSRYFNVYHAETMHGSQNMACFTWAAALFKTICFNTTTSQSKLLKSFIMFDVTEQKGHFKGAAFQLCRFSNVFHSVNAVWCRRTCILNRGFTSIRTQISLSSYLKQSAVISKFSPENWVRNAGCCAPSKTHGMIAIPPYACIDFSHTSMKT